MRILGVDPGSQVTGWGLVGGSPARSTLLECGTIELGRREPAAQRLARLMREFEALVRTLEPSNAAVETPFHGVNARSALQLAQARGVILAVLASAGVEVAEYTPATVKKSVTGNGRADKQQVQTMVGHLLGRAVRGSSDDVSDALAVALCHAACSGTQARIERALGRTPRQGTTAATKPR